MPSAANNSNHRTSRNAEDERLNRIIPNNGRSGSVPAPRERLALPYSTLLALMLSADETTLELDFASRVVTVKGKRLYEIFCVLAAGRGEGIFARSASDEMTLSRANKAPFISEIRIKETVSG